MAMNGTLLLGENSDAAYKALLTELTAQDLGLARMTYGLALEALRTLRFRRREAILKTATLLWCQQRLLSALLVSVAAPRVSGRSLSGAIDAVRPKVRVVRGGARTSERWA